MAARPAQPRVALPGDPQHASGAEAEALEQLQQEVVALQQERARVARMRLELEEAAGRLEQDKAAFEKRKVGQRPGVEQQLGLGSTKDLDSGWMLLQQLNCTCLQCRCRRWRTRPALMRSVPRSCASCRWAGGAGYKRV